MRIILLTVLLLWVSNFTTAQTASKFPKTQVLADLESLHQVLEDAHYNLYAYTSKQTFDTNYSRIKNRITTNQKDSLSLLEVTNLFQQVVSVVNIGHTNIDFPIQSYLAYAYGGGTLFPLELAFENNKALVRKNWSDNDIAIDSEVISINGITIDSVLAKIHAHVAAESMYLKNAKIEFYSFPRYYWQVIGKQDSFAVEVRSNDVITIHKLAAVAVIDGYESKRDEIITNKKELKFFNQTAYLNTGSFGGDEKQFRQFIDSAFVVIGKNKSPNLIIDLRNNAGGDDAFSDYVVSYIADKPFVWNSNFKVKTSKSLKTHTRVHNDTTQKYAQEILNHKDGEIYNYQFEAYQPQAQEKRFVGNVYVLVNRQSHSQSAVTAAQIQDYQFGAIVGEPTGDYPTLYASIFQYVLPLTRIPVNIPKGYTVRVNGSEKQEGVQPDIFIKDHLLDEHDEILNAVLKKIAFEKKR